MGSWKVLSNPALGAGSLPGEEVLEAQEEGGGRVMGNGNGQMEESCYSLEADMR